MSLRAKSGTGISSRSASSPESANKENARNVCLTHETPRYWIFEMHREVPACTVKT